MSRIHFLGVNGVCMRSLAEFIAKKGHNVSGTDLRKAHIEGVQTFLQDDQVHFNSTVDIVIYNSDIPKSNIEYVFAKNNKIPILHRAQILEDITQNRFKIAITGSSGKTSTTLYIYSLLQKLNVDPFIFLGEANFNNNRCMDGGDGPYIVEMNEGDMKYAEDSSDITVFNNFSEDHIWSFENKTEMINYYINFFKRSGYIIYNADDVEVNKIMKQVSSDKVSFGFNKNINHNHEYYQIINFQESITDIKFQLLVTKDNNSKKHFIVTPLHGKFSAYNVTAAIIIAHKFTNLAIDDIVQYTKHLSHSKRRMETLYIDAQLTIIEDQALHFTEHENSLDCLKKYGQKISVITDVVRSNRAIKFKNQYDQVWKGYKIAVTDQELKSPNRIFLQTEQDVFKFLDNTKGICAIFVKRYFIRDAVKKWIQSKKIKMIQKAD